ncbi:winged helix-turn-helix domain-containing protein [Nonomuraea sp. B12E4]|uniref:winged helix-turn-helix domain-containing protein n=1 Tax=Nonomuraea sp. B12E4 TaxID=3153564 RepID=UPI00325DB107
MPDLVRVDPYARKAWAGERLLKLRPPEWRLLVALTAQPGTLLTWRSLAAAISTGRPASKKCVQINAVRVRSQLGDPAYVQTVPGVGLRFTADLAEDIYLGEEKHRG